MLTGLIVIIILQCIQISNPYIINPKLMLCQLYLSKKKKKCTHTMKEVLKNTVLMSHDSPVISFLVALGSKFMAYRSETVTVQPCLLSSSTATFFKDPLKDLGS